jgi:hypothetical protein
MILNTKNLPEDYGENYCFSTYWPYDFGDYGIGCNNKNKMFYVKYENQKLRISKYFKTPYEAFKKMLWIIECDEWEIIQQLRIDGIIE